MVHNKLLLQKILVVKQLQIRKNGNHELKIWVR